VVKMMKIAGLALLAMVVFLSGCSSSPTANSSQAPASDEAKQPDAGKEPALQKARPIEGWYAKGEDGGYFSALQQGYYKDMGSIVCG